MIINKLSTLEGKANLLPSSKSISNRALILNALSGNQSIVSNLSSARDTQLMMRLINDESPLIDVMDAGTTMRFLTAYFAISGMKKTLTGTARMRQRPIGLLVNALQAVGVTINYLENNGFPPHEIIGYHPNNTNTISIPGNISSQYISALMMIAPILPKGLTIQLKGKVGSRPYIQMTAELMSKFGIQCDFSVQTIHIPNGKYNPVSYSVEADWSAASYWFAFTALAENASITLPNISSKSLQGDRVVVEIMAKLGVITHFADNQVFLSKSNHSTFLEWDFTDCPDLAQTVLPVCACKGISGKFTGLESLRIKESDRIAALQTELGKIGAKISEESVGVWTLTPSTGWPGSGIQIDTYHDHRMAMGLAPLATLMKLEIKDPEVVNKSYPGFWADMKSVGFTLA
ncbi:MAG: 3-phosphoshikimate 1-carboxyvinyltransferase [Bacteroidia bacterium]|nr:3-phosphoshikimate 1-carboxyvinyltransferase [Bacteroidia bacterium]